MSKAFTRETDGNDTDSGDDASSSGPAIPKGVKNYITPVGFARLKDELKRLLHTERPELVKTISWAAGNGDRSENGDYIYGKRRLREIDRRIRFLGKRLDAAEVVDPSSQKSERIVFGATVTVLNEEGESRKYVIVGIDETDAQRGRVSWISPLAKALLGAQAGDAVQLKTPRGEQELEILRVDYLPVE
ncbi:MAG: transcription elongation factor GreB [Deltaproteobacteria bacterium]|nr:transcription elongation factor GreB [Deltaproteobacteria bacterium]